MYNYSTPCSTQDIYEQPGVGYFDRRSGRFLGRGSSGQQDTGGGGGAWDGNGTSGAGGSGTTTAWIDFADTTWSAATITANGAMIYNSTQGNRTVCILAFGGDKTSTLGDFTIIFPTPNNTSAIIRIA